MSLPKHHATRVGLAPHERFICAECLFPWPCESAERAARRAESSSGNERVKAAAVSEDRKLGTAA